MKILIICQYYYPEPFSITDICENLTKNGHSVEVVTGVPNYPMGIIYSEYKKGKKREEIINGVKVHRCYTIGRRKGGFWRLLNYYSFSMSSTKYIKKINKDFDVVFVNQLSPVMMANAALLYKKLYNTRIVLYCLDLWPDSLSAGGIKKDSLIYKHFERISKRIYRSVDEILITSKSFEKYFVNKMGISRDKIKYLPQYADDTFLDKFVKKDYNKNSINLVFAGNIGIAQSIETIIMAANILKTMKNLKWHIVGDGADFEKCKRMVHKLSIDSVIFHGRKKIEEMLYYYNMADAMLITMIDDDVLSLTLPGKMQTYLAAGKIVIGSINGETQRIINESKCGYCCDAEDYHKLAEIVCEFINDKNKKEKELNSRNYYLKYFSKNNFMKTLGKELGDNCRIEKKEDDY